jgi:sec-independent protein translocase protein TatA
MHAMFAFALGPVQLIIVGVIAVLLFGERLPEVARKFGKSFMEFKKGFREIEDQIRTAITTTPSSSGTSSSSWTSSSPSYPEAAEDHDQATAPKFEPPPAPASETCVGKPEG